MSNEVAEIHHLRRSACADAALQAEIARVSRMTIEERITASLTMRERFAWIQPEGKTQAAKEK